MSPILLARTRVNQSLSERALAGGKHLTILQEMKLSQNILADGIRKEGLMMLTTADLVAGFGAGAVQG
eukprot:Awhi_evm1s12734